MLIHRNFPSLEEALIPLLGLLSLCLVGGGWIIRSSIFWYLSSPRKSLSPPTSSPSATTLLPFSAACRHTSMIIASCPICSTCSVLPLLSLMCRVVILPFLCVVAVVSRSVHLGLVCLVGGRCNVKVLYVSDNFYRL